MVGKYGNWEMSYSTFDLQHLETEENEIRQQVISFFGGMGRKPTHIDLHQDVHLREKMKHLVIHIA